MKHKDLYQNLLKEFSDLPKTPKKIDHSNYAVANVGPAVVPNPYLPSFRIFTYNITGTPYVPDQDQDSMESNHTKRRDHLGDLEAVCADAVHRNSWKCLLSQPWHSSPHSPSRQNRLFTPTGYAQVRLGFDALYNVIKINWLRRSTISPSSIPQKEMGLPNTSWST